MKAILERHGESMGNVWGGAYADDKTNFLSLRGVKQAELSAYTISELIPHEFDVVISSELEEIMNLCDRIIVIAEGRLVDEVKREAFSQKALMAGIVKQENSYEN